MSLILPQKIAATALLYGMNTPPYSSVPESKNSKRKKKHRNEPSKRAQDSFEALQPFINAFDCGLIWRESPFHAITKEDWNLFRRHKAGERNLCYPDGRTFNPYLDVVRNIFGPEHVHQHIEYDETTYYTSGKKRLGLLYLDIDAHHGWQTDEYRAKAVLKKLFRFGYFRASPGGQNGYLKVRYNSIFEFNRAAGSLQQRLRRLFLHWGIFCDIEVKGTITHRGKSGSLAKLPFNNKFPCNMRDGPTPGTTRSFGCSRRVRSRTSAGMTVKTTCLAHCYRGGVFAGVLWMVWERKFVKDRNCKGSVSAKPAAEAPGKTAFRLSGHL